MQMMAAVMRVQRRPHLYAESLPMTSESVDLDPPGEAVDKIIGAGLRHSTIGNPRPRRSPMIPSHEAVGPGVTGPQPGDVVLRCRYCDNGRRNPCRNSAVARDEATLVSRRLSCLHDSGLSGFAQYAVVSRTAPIEIPEDMALEDATIFGCAVVTVMDAVPRPRA